MRKPLSRTKFLQLRGFAVDSSAESAARADGRQNKALWSSPRDAQIDRHTSSSTTQRRLLVSLSVYQSVCPFGRRRAASSAAWLVRFFARSLPHRLDAPSVCEDFVGMQILEWMLSTWLSLSRNGSHIKSGSDSASYPPRHNMMAWHRLRPRTRERERASEQDEREIGRLNAHGLERKD